MTDFNLNTKNCSHFNCNCFVIFCSLNEVNFYALHYVNRFALYGQFANFECSSLFLAWTKKKNVLINGFFMQNTRASLCLPIVSRYYAINAIVWVMMFFFSIEIWSRPKEMNTLRNDSLSNIVTRSLNSYLIHIILALI